MLTITVPIPSRLTSDTVVPFPDDFLGHFEVDASSLQFVEPVGLVKLTLLMQHLNQVGWATFKAPNDISVNNYLARMDFYQHVPAWPVTVQGGVDPSSIRQTDRSDVLIPVRSFNTEDHVEDMELEVSRFLQRLVSEKKLPYDVYSTLMAAIPELAGNVIEHSQSKCGGYLVAQRYSNSSSYLAVGDIGIGIRKHLTGNPKYADIETDVESIEMAIKPGVTGTRDNRGMGLDVVLEKLEEACSAALYIRSGVGWVRTLVSKSRRQRTSGTTAVNFPGTLIQLVVNT